MHIEYPPSYSIRVLLKTLKGRSSHHLQQGFPMFKSRYWAQHFFCVGYGVWSTGNVTEEMIQAYLEHHKDKPNSLISNWILES